MIEDKLAQGPVGSDGQGSTDLQTLCKDLADKSKQAIKSIPNQDPRYKFMVQVLVGQNSGQGIRMGSRQFWDEENDNLCFVTVIKEKYYITVAAFACYLY